MKKFLKSFSVVVCALIIGALLPVLPMVTQSLASADVAVDSFVGTTPNPLPTVQIDGIVWAQAIIGNTVYATGRFTTARPAGVALGGAGSVTRSNILAYDIRTGVLNTSFVHALTGTETVEGKAITASPDGTRLYVGGTFTAVDGQPRSNLAAFDVGTGALLPDVGVNGPNNTVQALAATNTTAYAGGSFSRVGSLGRSRLAAFDLSGNLLPWSPLPNGRVAALVMTPDNSKVVIGGSFSTLNGSTYHAFGAVSASGDGAPVAWASQSDTFPFRDEDPVKSGAGITSLSANGNTIFLTAFNFISGKMDGGFEGRAAISPDDGHLIWMNDCHGDSYSAFPIGNVLYSVSHAHDCQPAAGFPQTNPMIMHRVLAETTTPDGVNGPGTNNYWNYQGQPRSDQLDWYPILNTGTVSGANQGAWSITGNSSFVSLGGEFTQASHIGQQGLVRYAVTPLALSSYALAAANAGKGGGGTTNADSKTLATDAAKTSAAKSAAAAAAKSASANAKVLAATTTNRPSATALLSDTGLNIWIPSLMATLTLGVATYVGKRKLDFHKLHRFDNITI